MKKLLILITLITSSCWLHAEESWSWLRVENGVLNPVVMNGYATTVSNNQGKLVLRLTDKDKYLNDFVVNIRISGNRAEAQFEPPNTEKLILRLTGHYSQSVNNSGNIYEEIILANTQSGNFLVISRFRKK
jgi:hypothetical protein